MVGPLLSRGPTWGSAASFAFNLNEVVPTSRGLRRFPAITVIHDMVDGTGILDANLATHSFTKHHKCAHPPNQPMKNKNAPHQPFFVLNLASWFLELIWILVF